MVEFEAGSRVWNNSISRNPESGKRRAEHVTKAEYAEYVTNVEELLTRGIPDGPGIRGRGVGIECGPGVYLRWYLRPIVRFG